jgi:pimeloyl-ACP methyl ester carboxylesterase
VVFGREGKLAGIVTLPSSQNGASSSTAFVILNSGVIHRVGANRLSVRMARAMADLGLTVLRFDQSGLGDSEARTDVDDLEESVERDIDEAMEHLANEMKIDRFVFAGLCTGANQSLQTAWRDPRVVGAVLLDPPGYRTPRSVATYYARQALKPGSWWNVLSGRNHYWRLILNRLRSRRKNESSQPVESGRPDRLPSRPSREEMRSALGTLTERGTRLLFLYTGSFEVYLYPDQLRDAFPEACASEALCWCFMPETNHTFSREEHRRVLLRTLTTWLKDSGLAAGSR